MRSTYSILALEYMPVSVAGGVRKAVGGFLRYVQYRDQHFEPERGGGLDDYVRYVAHRDRTSPAGRVFSRDENDVDRRRFVEYVTRSTKGLQPKLVRNAKGELEDRHRAVYQMIVSPEDWRGLDLRQIARVAMQQLENDAGAGGLGPWFAAEHRNTAHHHVHIVLAARREIAPGKFQTLLITRPRLQRMKESIWAEIERQRGLVRGLDRSARTSDPITLAETEQRRQPRSVSSVVDKPVAKRVVVPRWRWITPRTGGAGRSDRRLGSRSRSRHVRVAEATVFGLRAIALRYQGQMQRELERQAARSSEQEWER